MASFGAAVAVLLLTVAAGVCWHFFVLPEVRHRRQQVRLIELQTRAVLRIRELEAEALAAADQLARRRPANRPRRRPL